MIIVSSERPHCQSVRPKRAQSALNEDIDLDAKAYRYLLAIWSDNINSLVRCHRDCLGEMEQLPKIKISREEQQAMAEQIQKIYCKFQDKLLREPLVRNGQVGKSIADYSQLSKCKPREFYWDSPMEEKSQLGQFVVGNSLIESYQTKKGFNFHSTTPSLTRRPMSSKLTSKIATLNQAINGFLGSNLAQAYKMKTISAHASDNPQSCKGEKAECLMMGLQKAPLREELFRGKRVFTNSKPRDKGTQKRYSQKDDFDRFDFNGNEIVISQKRVKDRQSFELEISETPKALQSGKVGNKRMLSLKYSQRKSIDQIERMQIQNRIMMVNSVLSVNLPQSQGYRPKSKCWQNYFNQ